MINNSVTVVIPTFNSIKYVQQCVESVLNQKYPYMKILLCDNESADGTYEYLQTIKDERVELISLPNIYPNGYREAILYSYENVKTDYVTFVCSDDYLNPNYIALNMKYIKKCPQYKCFQSGLTFIKNNQIIGNVCYKYNNIDEFKQQFMNRCPVNNPTFFYTIEMLKCWTDEFDGREAHKYNNLNEIGAGDYDVWGHMASNNIFIYPINAYLGYNYRFHNEQATWKVKQTGINYDKMIQDYYRNKWGL